ncbi:MAG: SDR family NAD(P)-dependent oxidoreductase, partial [Pseudomonadota bacterium]
MKDKVIAITGASSGIGLALAHAFARRGNHLSLCARREVVLEAEAEKLRAAYSVQVHTAAVDVTDAAACQQFIEETVHTYGRLDVLVCNAGISMRAQLADLELKVLEQVMDVNFWGAVYCA